MFISNNHYDGYYVKNSWKTAICLTINVELNLLRALIITQTVFERWVDATITSLHRRDISEFDQCRGDVDSVAMSLRLRIAKSPTLKNNLCDMALQRQKCKKFEEDELLSS